MKSDFYLLKRKLLSHAMTIVASAIVIGILIRILFIDGILEAPFADTFIAVYQRIFRADWNEAEYAYHLLFRNNKSELLMAGALLLAVIVFYNSLTMLIQYFKEVGDGINQLSSEHSPKIQLSPELTFIERKLNETNQALQNHADELKQATQRKDELVMYLAHDIRTPLTSVVGYLNLLNDSYNLSEEERKKYTQIAMNKANHLELLVNEFFEITRYNNHTIVLEKEHIDLSYMLVQLTDEFYPLAEASHKKIELCMDSHLNIVADPDKLARMFNNLLKNAVNYSNNHSTIKINASLQDHNTMITFTNYGSVIPQSELEAIFSKHYRLDAARSTNTGGAGIGLAITKEIAELHGGTVTANSDEQGTIFIVCLPLS